MDCHKDIEKPFKCADDLGFVPTAAQATAEVSMPSEWILNSLYLGTDQGFK